MAYYTSYFPRGKFDILRWERTVHTIHRTLFKHFMADGHFCKIYENLGPLSMNVYVRVHVVVCMNVQLKTINTSNEALNTQIMARQMYAGYRLHPTNRKTK